MENSYVILYQESLLSTPQIQPTCVQDDDGLKVFTRQIHPRFIKTSTLSNALSATFVSTNLSNDQHETESRQKTLISVLGDPITLVLFEDSILKNPHSDHATYSSKSTRNFLSPDAYLVAASMTSFDNAIALSKGCNFLAYVSDKHLQLHKINHHDQSCLLKTVYSMTIRSRAKSLALIEYLEPGLVVVIVADCVGVALYLFHLSQIENIQQLSSTKREPSVLKSSIKQKCGLQGTDNNYKSKNKKRQGITERKEISQQSCFYLPGTEGHYCCNVQVSGDSHWLAVASMEGIIAIWSVAYLRDPDAFVQHCIPVFKYKTLGIRKKFDRVIQMEFKHPESQQLVNTSSTTLFLGVSMWSSSLFVFKYTMEGQSWSLIWKKKVTNTNKEITDTPGSYIAWSFSGEHLALAFNRNLTIYCMKTFCQVYAKTFSWPGRICIKGLSSTISHLVLLNSNSCITCVEWPHPDILKRAMSNRMDIQHNSSKLYNVSRDICSYLWLNEYSQRQVIIKGRFPTLFHRIISREKHAETITELKLTLPKVLPLEKLIELIDQNQNISVFNINRSFLSFSLPGCILYADLTASYSSQSGICSPQWHIAVTKGMSSSIFQHAVVNLEVKFYKKRTSCPVIVYPNEMENRFDVIICGKHRSKKLGNIIVDPQGKTLVSCQSSKSAVILWASENNDDTDRKINVVIVDLQESFVITKGKVKMDEELLNDDDDSVDSDSTKLSGDASIESSSSLCDFKTVLPLTLQLSCPPDHSNSSSHQQSPELENTRLFQLRGCIVEPMVHKDGHTVRILIEESRCKERQAAIQRWTQWWTCRFVSRDGKLVSCEWWAAENQDEDDPLSVMGEDAIESE